MSDCLFRRRPELTNAFTYANLSLALSHGRDYLQVRSKLSSSPHFYTNNRSIAIPHLFAVLSSPHLSLSCQSCFNLNLTTNVAMEEMDRPDNPPPPVIASSIDRVTSVSELQAQTKISKLARSFGCHRPTEYQKHYCSNSAKSTRCSARE
jgi:hypothetical protein